MCFGLSGAFTRRAQGLAEARRHAVCRRSPTQGTGDDAEGPSDIVVNGKRVTGLIGGGHTPDARTALGDDGALFGWVVKVDPWKGSVWPFADIVQYEADHNPDGGEVDSNANGIAVRHGGYVVADAGGNSVLGVNHKKAHLDAGRVPGHARRRPAVPRAAGRHADPDAGRPDDRRRAAEGPEHLRRPADGLPVPARRRRACGPIAPDGTKTVYASGFTNIIDIAWGPKGSLYVLEISANGILSGDPTGALIRVWPNGKQTVVASKGLVVAHRRRDRKDGSVYVANYGTSAGAGTVVNIGKV